jgi:hypothetical protein
MVSRADLHAVVAEVAALDAEKNARAIAAEALIGLAP